jgi:hypothetical protein
LSLAYSKTGNGQILGFNQEEVTTFASINYALSPLVTISLGYSDTNSNIDYFDHREPSFGIEFTPIEF